MPLDVDKGIELPQLELISTKNDDCTTVYSTGNKYELYINMIYMGYSYLIYFKIVQCFHTTIL